MLLLNAKEIRSSAPMPRLIECLQTVFRTEYVVPARQVWRKCRGRAGERLSMSMPAFELDGSTEVRLATVFLHNQAKGCADHPSGDCGCSPTPGDLLDPRARSHWSRTHRRAACGSGVRAGQPEASAAMKSSCSSRSAR